MQSLKYWALALTFVAGTAHAGEAQISGMGEVTHPVEYVELSATVQAECYDSPRAATDAADELAEKVYEQFTQHVQTTGDELEGVFSRGGFTQPFVRHERGETYCLGTFKKSTTITLRTKNIDQFESVFNEIQSDIYDLPTIQGRGERLQEAPLAYVTLDQPDPRLTEATRQSMERMALERAMADARAEFEAAAANACNVTYYEITNIQEPTAHSGPVERARAIAEAPAAGPQAPVRFDQKTIHKNLIVTFRYEGGRCSSQ